MVSPCGCRTGRPNPKGSALRHFRRRPHTASVGRAAPASPLRPRRRGAKTRLDGIQAATRVKRQRHPHPEHDLLLWGGFDRGSPRVVPRPAAARVAGCAHLLESEPSSSVSLVARGRRSGHVLKILREIPEGHCREIRRGARPFRPISKPDPASRTARLLRCAERLRLPPDSQRCWHQLVAGTSWWYWARYPSASRSGG